MRIKILSLLIVAGLSGCSLAPDYQRPVSSSSDGWQGMSQEMKNEAALPDWRTFMSDQQLQSLIESALKNNKDLKQTLLNVASLQAQYRIQDSARFPALNVDGSGTRQRTSDAVTGNGTVYSSQYSATVGVTSYELDLFGRVKNLSDQALESYIAEDENRRSAVISLVSEVASAYIRLLAEQELLNLTKDTVKAYKETLALVQTRYDSGYSSALTLAQSKTALHSAEATLATYKLSVSQQYNTLRQLIGAPLKLKIESRLPEEDGRMLTALAVGAPSELLLSRPDILSAEHSLKAANANVGAARAAFFPRISLTANAGSMSSSLDDLFGSGSGMWQFIPSISVPVFDWGNNQASLDVAKISKQKSVIAYQQAIETGFKEVSDALLGQQYYMEEWHAQQSNLAANKDYYDLAKMRYEQGNDSYMDLLDAQRSLFSARESELSAHLNLLVSRVSLYKALGGGWRAADQEEATQVPLAVTD
ncbi:Outer membrane protein OprM precursor [Vibrio aerogenes CECT 7868]|uniref:Outer membrane protein OprM n=1 Tax=Vibrio aerogenes CECT 7868 TaxID=1216006 RepID=A0A1M6CC47_9VIBR|nr:efflux transporter outer membrane subunit [Vibrio aerogenes]SHI58401.1 Outer membrane protein OprM precursor [Vibrio aerogenes CECT 7868]